MVHTDGNFKLKAGARARPGAPHRQLPGPRLPAVAGSGEPRLPAPITAAGVLSRVTGSCLSTQVSNSVKVTIMMMGTGRLTVSHRSDSELPCLVARRPALNLLPYSTAPFESQCSQCWGAHRAALPLHWDSCHRRPSGKR